MVELVVVSLVWAFSFGLIKGELTGLDPSFVAFARMALALVVFLPFLRPRGLRLRSVLELMAIGGLQFGVMYVFYIRSYRHLMAFEVALLTIFTPLLITLFDGLLSRRWAPRFHLAALLAIAGAAVIVYRGDESPPWTGILLLQVANVAFALGQLWYRRFKRRHPRQGNREMFAFAYGGAVAVTAVAAALSFEAEAFAPTGRQALVLVYLGVLASGLCFFLWNRGATRVGVGTLAVMNNGYIPLAVLCSLLLFGEEADLPRLAIGSVLLLAALALNPLRPR
jgi:drug/metabolite transporter (DMT)-like permease